MHELIEAAASLVRTSCREDLGPEHNHDRCNKPAEFVLWGKLIAPKGLGPRCYDHAAKHVGHSALSDPSWAILDLRPTLRALELGQSEGSSSQRQRNDRLYTRQGEGSRLMAGPGERLLRRVVRWAMPVVVDEYHRRPLSEVERGLVEAYVAREVRRINAERVRDGFAPLEVD